MQRKKNISTIKKAEFKTLAGQLFSSDNTDNPPPIVQADTPHSHGAILTLRFQGFADDGCWIYQGSNQGQTASVSVLAANPVNRSYDWLSGPVRTTRKAPAGAVAA